jgi:hypothetical protein
MTEPQTFIYECYITTLETGQQVMVQLFRDPKTFDCLHVQMAFKSPAFGTWGNPYQMESRNK